jgi:large subunit ribosomal protein L15
MDLNTLIPAKGANRVGFRKGRGNGSGLGKTAGRGQKGAGARKSSGKGKVAFEGGNFPLWRATPKRGFKTRFVKDTQIVNLSSLEKLEVSEVNAEVLASHGIIHSAAKPVKILGFGELSKALTVSATAFSKTAIAAIEKAGGKIELDTTAISVIEKTASAAIKKARGKATTIAAIEKNAKAAIAKALGKTESA